MNQPFISICIPAYQRPDLLKKLLDSIKMQTFKNFEVLVNDNSPDDSVEALVKGYQSELPISYVRNQPAVTAAANCNKVMQRAKADWIKLMHDDDWFASENALQLFADAAIHSGKDFIFSASVQVWLDSGKTQDDELEGEKKQMLEDSRFSLFYLNVIGHPSVAMHKKDNTVQYDLNFKWVLDIDYYVRYLGAHPGYHYIPEKLVNIGKGPTQETNKYYKNRMVELPEHFYLLAKYEPDLCLKHQPVFHLIWNMIKRYKIRHTDDIYATGYKGPMPARIEKIIAFQKYIPRIIIKQTPWSKWLMKKCYAKVAKDYIASRGKNGS